MDPAIHYLKFGYKEGRNPSRIFDTNTYFENIPEAKSSGICPLIHYLNSNKKDKPYIKNSYQQFIKERGIDKNQILKEIDNFHENGISENTNNCPKINISLTSYEARLKDIKYTIYSLLNQTVKPDKIILYLGKDSFPNGDNDLPKDLVKFKQFGLSIKYTKDIFSYTKIIPALKEYPNDIIVTCDDDIFYKRDFLEKLISEYKMHKDSIIAHRVHKVSFSNGVMKRYNDWDHEISGPDESLLNFPTRVGGVLYTPNIFYKDLLNEELFMKLSPKADDIWIWAMAILNNKKIRVPKDSHKILTYVNPETELNLNGMTSLQIQNVKENRNDTYLKNIMNYYPEIEKILETA